MKVRKILLRVGLVLVGLVVALVAYVQLRWRRTFDVPLPTIAASRDSAIIGTGRYLAFGPAHCAYCHSPADAGPALDRGEQPPLIGGFTFDIPPGKIHTPNLTPDSATGIGAVSDGQLARMLRDGVRRDGRAALPFMNYHQLSDGDVVALISFLRSQTAVRHEVPPHDLSFVGKAVAAFMLKPQPPAQTPPVASPPPGATVERGDYLANAVAECHDCHTERSLVSGAFTGPAYAGGASFPVDGKPELVLTPPNLTPDPQFGRITSWTEDQFLARFRKGPLIKETIMPWNAFGRMSDDDIRAIYRYLRMLAPVNHDPGPSLRKKS